MKSVMASKPIYLDHHATTPVDPRVASCVIEAMRVHFGNSNSREHAYGQAAAAAEEDARALVAKLAGADEEDVHFTSSATEAIRAALAIAVSSVTGRPFRVALPATEHMAVIDAVSRLKRDGRAEVVWIDVDRAGKIDINRLESAIAAADLLCLMAANNEVGTLNPIEEAARIAQRNGVAIFVDATQAAGRIALRASDWAIDYMTMSSHKLYGPKGAGALIGPSVSGAFEGGLIDKGPTPNTPAIVGFGMACHLRTLEQGDDEARVARLRDRLEALLLARVEGLVVNGDVAARLSNNLHVSIPGVPNDAVVARLLRDVAISTGSACRTGAPSPSHVLTAMHLSDELVESALRISLGKFNTEEEIDVAAEAIAAAVADVRELEGLGAC